MRFGISVINRWAGVFCLVAAMATQQVAWAGGQPKNSASGSSAATHSAAQPDSPAADGSAAGNTRPSSDAQAIVPRLIKFSGVLQSLAGKPLAGPVDVTFSLYTDEAGGAPLWFETQTVPADAAGRYTVLLGAMSASGIPIELFTSGEAHWLGVQVANLPEQSRVLLVSVPYALKSGDAETLGGKPASAYMLSSQTDSTAAGVATTTGALSGLVKSTAAQPATTSESPVTQAITQSYVPVFTDSIGTLGNSIMFQSGTKIGVNTNSPAFNFDVNGSVFAVGTKTAAAGQGGTMRIRDDTGTVRWLFGMPGSAGSQDFFMYNYTNGHSPLYIENGAPSYSFYFASGGNIGLGTNAPSIPFDINKSIMALGPKTASSGVGGAMRLRNDTGTVQWSFGIPSSASATDFFLYNNVSGQQPFLVSSGTTNGTLNLTATGVGIGTGAPTAKLEVNGTAKFDSGVTFVSPVTFATSQNFGSTSSVLTASAATLSANNANQVLVATQSGAGAVAVFNNTTGGKILSGQNNGVEKFSLDGNGNVTGGTATFSGSTADKVLSVTQAGAGAVGIFNNTAGGKILSAQNNGVEKVSVNGNGDVTTVGKFTGDGSGLTNIGPSSVKTGVAYDISVTSATTASSADTATSADFASNADFATNAGGAGTFAGHQLPDFPLLEQDNTYVGNQVVDTGDFSVNSGKVAIGAGDLTLGTGKIGIGTSTPGKSVDVIGDIRANGCFLANATNLGGTCSSDVRLKTNIRPFSDVLDKIAGLQPVRFNWRVKEFPDYHFSDGESYGLIAQKVQKVFPDMVSTDEHGYMKVDYSQLPYLMLESIRELKTRNDSLEKTVRGQEGQIAQARAAIDNLGKANAEKDAKIDSLRSEIQQLRKAQAEMAALEKRLTVLESKSKAPRTGKQIATASARKSQKHGATEVARVGF